MKRVAVIMMVCGLAACGRLRYDLLDPIVGTGGSQGPGAAGGAGGAGGGATGAGGSTDGGAGGAGAGGGGAGGAATTGAGGAATTGAGGSTDGGAGGAATTGAGGSTGAGGAATTGAGGSTDGGAGGSGTGGAMDGGGGDVPAANCTPKMNGGRSYLFCDPRLDWASARAVCESRGMRLVRIDDAPEGAWVLANATFPGAAGNDSFWIGAYEPTTDGDWHWTDGAAFWTGAAAGMAVGSLYAQWDRREPNNAVGPEACGAIPLNNGDWFDYQCSASCYFVCEAY